MLSEFSEEEDCGTDERTTTKDKPPSSPTVEEILKSSPFTSPVKDDHNDDNVLDLFKNQVKILRIHWNYMHKD